jgi:hypothetical protein
MNKPDWKDAPKWAQWLAMDSDGEWWWFEEKPRLVLYHDFWVKHDPSSKYARAKFSDPPPLEPVLEPRPCADD